MLIEAAKKADIPYQIEAAVGRTGTDIDNCIKLLTEFLLLLDEDTDFNLFV